MDNLPVYKEIIETISANYRTKVGFLTFFLIFIPIFAIFRLSPIQLESQQIFYTIIGISLIHSVVWLFKSGKIIIPPAGKILVVSSIKTEEKAHYYLKSIWHYLHTELIDLDILPLFSIRHIGHDRFRQDLREAHHYREANNIDILIWGNAQNLKERGKDVAPFKLYFTYGVKFSRADQKIQLALDSALFVGDKQWLVYDEDSRTYTATVTNDLLEVTFIFLGISFMMLGKLDLSIKILQRAIILLDKKNEQTPIGVAKRKRAKDLLSEAIWEEFNEIRSGDKLRALGLMKRFLDLNPRSFPAHIGIARIEYELGNTNGAIEWTKKAREIEPRNPVLFINFAFLRILEKKYDRAARWYNKIALRRHIDTNFGEIIEFLGQHYDKEQDEHAYLFAMGVINFFHLDKGTGKNQLRNFINIASDPRYGGMVRLASQYLGTGRKEKKRDKRKAPRKRGKKKKK